MCGPIRRRVRLPPYLVLLRAGFAVPPSVTTGAVRSYRTISPLPSRDPKATRLGGLFSVALSVGSRPPGVTWRLALGARTFLHACAQRLPGRLHLESYRCGTVLFALFRAAAELYGARVQIAAFFAGELGGDPGRLRGW